MIHILDVPQNDRILHGDMDTTMEEDTNSRLTGSFLGHFIPGLFFICFSVFFMSLTFRRALRLANACDNVLSFDFAKLHIPERNKVILFRIGLMASIATTIGIFVEGANSIVCFGTLFGFASHQLLYLLFFFVGFCALLESFGKLPLDSCRQALVLAYMGNYVVWSQHASMKDNIIDQKVHEIMSQLCLVSAASTAYSVIQPNCIMSFLLSWASLLMQGLWLFTIGFNLINHGKNQYLTHHNLSVYITTEVLTVAFIIACGTSLVFSKLNNTRRALTSLDLNNTEFTRINKTLQNDDCSDDNMV